MSFKGKDPLGRTVFLAQDVFDHSMKKHFGFLGTQIRGLYGQVTFTLENPTFIFEDPPSEGRKGQEIYVSNVIPDWGVRIHIPVAVYDSTVFSWPPHPTIEPPVRVAMTAYDEVNLPSGKVLWKGAI